MKLGDLLWLILAGSSATTIIPLLFNHCSTIVLYNFTKTSSKVTNPTNPKIGYMILTRFVKPKLAKGILVKERKIATSSWFLPLDNLLIKPKPLARAVVNIAIQRIIV